MKFILLFILIISIYSFILMRIDKYRAAKNRIRISEKALLLHAFFLGSLGIFLGMHFPSNHKTQVWKFKLGVPLLALLQIVGAVYLYNAII